jgi:hypothetical protein
MTAKTLRIAIVMPSDYGCEISDASRDAYVERVERAIAEEFPGASITITHGGFETRVSGDADSEEVRALVQREWERFCGDAEAWVEPS